jgi:hypothetical protein
MLNPDPLKAKTKPLLKGMGWPMRDLTTFLNKAAWVHSTNNLKDVWFCTSLQRDSGKNTRGNPKAVRGAHLALKQKSIWIDVDVDPADPKKYPTIEVALRELLAFVAAVRLPTPSSIVFSGGGLHVYWISDVPLDPPDWQTYAQGLKNLLLANAIKCDTGLTTDIARILRVPGTFNHKYDPPKEVSLAVMPLTIYNFPTQLSFLKQFAGPPGPSPKTPNVLYADGVTPESFGKPNPLFAGLNDTLGAGIGVHSDQSLKAEPIFKQCKFMGHALKTGGADYDNPLWNLSVLCSTFMENGNAIAHAISQGHVSYTKDDTQALYDRKVADRHDRGLGYPSCSTIQSNGCKSCATCPLFSKGKSPLNIRPPVTAAVTAAALGQTAPARALSLPMGFDLNDEGIICKVVELTDKEGELQPPVMIPLFYCVITDPWVQKVPDCINFTITVDRGFTHPASVKQSEISKTGFAAYLGNDQNRIKITGEGIRHLQGFFLAWIAKLHALAAAEQAQPFGWYYDGPDIRGFVFGGNVMEDDGSVRPCGIGDHVIKQRYTPVGDIQDWYDAAATITNRKRPELTTILVASFAAPLLLFTGENSSMLSAMGESGAGKSGAISVGLAVWGHPKTTKGDRDSTQVGVINQVAETRNLPYYWDELQFEEDRKRAISLSFTLCGGIEKARGTSEIGSRVRREWAMIPILASNAGVVDQVLRDNNNDAASIVRVLEWNVKKINGGAGWMPGTDAAVLVRKLERSYGMMGVKYAHYLAVNHKRIEKEVQDLTLQVQIDLGNDQAERFWRASVACLILGAKYAKELGVGVEPDEIKTFMYDVMKLNREKRDRYGMVGSVVDNGEEALAGYLNSRKSEERMVWTDTMPTGVGKPPVCLLLKQPTQPKNTTGPVEVRWAVDAGRLVIGAKDFRKYLDFAKFTAGPIDDTLKLDYSATFGKTKMFFGTPYDAGRVPTITIPVTPEQASLWGMMCLPLSAEKKAAMEADYWARKNAMASAQANSATPVPPISIETGFEDGPNEISQADGTNDV